MNIKSILKYLIKTDSTKKEQSENKGLKIEEVQELPSVEHTIAEFQDCVDLVHRTFSTIEANIFYFDHLVDQDKLQREIIVPFSTSSKQEIERLLQEFPFTKEMDRKEFIKGILKGFVGIFHENQAYYFDVIGPQARAITESETESIITGPHDAFVESIGTNLSLIRRRIRSTHLKTVKVSAGEITKTEIYLVYIQGLVNTDMLSAAIFNGGVYLCFRKILCRY